MSHAHTASAARPARVPAPTIPDLMSTKQARIMLGGPMLSLSRFWEIIHERNVPYRSLGSRGAAFERAVIQELVEFLTVRTPADRARVADKRHKFSWSVERA